MTKKQWAASRDPQAMLAEVGRRCGTTAGDQDRYSRALHLFAAGCFRLVRSEFPADRYPTLVAAADVAERVGLGLVPADALQGRPDFAEAARRYGGEAGELLAALTGGWYGSPLRVRPVVLCRLGRRQAGPPPPAASDPRHPWHAAFRRATASAEAYMADLLRCVADPFRPQSLDPRWRTTTAVGLAEAIHAERAFDRMPILADALEDAGCDDPAVLAHARSDAHARGCWVLDLVLGRRE